MRQSTVISQIALVGRRARTGGNLKNGLYYYTLTDNGTIVTRGKFIIAEE
jgi:hypothetical protein